MRRERWTPFRKRPRPVADDPPSSSSGHVVLADVNAARDAADTQFDTEWDDLSGVEVVAGEFVTVTADTGSASRYQHIGGLLQRVRARTGMDVVFISQFVHGMRVIRHVAADARDPYRVSEGAADPLETTYCQRVLDGRLPRSMADVRRNAQAAQLPLTRAFDVRAHMAAPIVTSDGRVFGTVCAYAHQPRSDLASPLAVLNAVARALARALDAEHG